MAAAAVSVMGCFVVCFPCSGSGPGIDFAVLHEAGHGMLVISSWAASLLFCMTASAYTRLDMMVSVANAPSHLARVGCAWTCICPCLLRDSTAATAAAAHSCTAAWGPS
eukprot:GHRQ01022711.1.p1 GENE.GHRQ01022711.1~~GHRQ01022711.1.p1  ORF type:complete len:109 (+),score=20.06 GHRQ01022711.1:529-855(+)